MVNSTAPMKRKALRKFLEMGKKSLGMYLANPKVKMLITVQKMLRAVKSRIKTLNSALREEVVIEGANVYFGLLVEIGKRCFWNESELIAPLLLLWLPSNDSKGKGRQP
jgi:hypothetical protein